MAQLIEDVFRREKSRVVGGLVRWLGSIDAAEEAFADAIVTALAKWPSDGTPANPAAWLTTTAQNAARDAIRHRRVVDEKAPLLIADEVAPTVEAIGDDELRLIFTCCHPALTLESQVALTLKIVAGLSVEDIASAFLAPDKTIAQRITRAKKTLEGKRYEVPARAELPQRLSAVLAVIYLVENNRLHGVALRLIRSLADLLPNEPEVFGLFALIAFACARASDERVVLARQDRSQWDLAMIKEGLMALERSRRLGACESYSLQAEIAACHMTATWETTDWPRILALYDQLVGVDTSPVVALNRAVAVSMCTGPAAALAELAPLESALANYRLFYNVRADLRRKLGEDARDDDDRAETLRGPM